MGSLIFCRRKETGDPILAKKSLFEATTFISGRREARSEHYCAMQEETSAREGNVLEKRSVRFYSSRENLQKLVKSGGARKIHAEYGKEETLRKSRRGREHDRTYQGDTHYGRGKKLLGSPIFSLKGGDQLLLSIGKKIRSEK